MSSGFLLVEPDCSESELLCWKRREKSLVSKFTYYAVLLPEISWGRWQIKTQPQRTWLIRAHWGKGQSWEHCACASQQTAPLPCHRTWAIHSLLIVMPRRLWLVIMYRYLAVSRPQPRHMNVTHSQGQKGSACEQLCVKTPWTESSALNMCPDDSLSARFFLSPLFFTVHLHSFFAFICRCFRNGTSHAPRISFLFFSGIRS